MFYLPPHEFWYLTAARLTTIFDDRKESNGTGFFVYHDQHYFLITARHVVDPKYLPPSEKRHAICRDLTIQFQAALNAGTKKAAIVYQTLLVSDPEFCYDGDDVDVAVIKIPKEVLPIVRGGDEIRPCSFPFSYLATNDDLALRYAGEPIVFVGFPDNSPVNSVGKSKFHYPLLRQGVFAFPPIRGVDIEGQLGRDYGLMDSYAQSGFSGGPVISLQKGWADGAWHPKEDFRPSKVVGLVCGHYRSARDRSDGGHAGLSFFARTTSIRNVIETIQATT